MQNKWTQLNLNVKPSPINKKGRYRAAWDPKFLLRLRCLLQCSALQQEHQVLPTRTDGLTAVTSLCSEHHPLPCNWISTPLTPTQTSQQPMQKLWSNLQRSNLPLLTLIQWPAGNFSWLTEGCLWSTQLPAPATHSQSGIMPRALQGQRSRQVRHALRCNTSHTGGRLGAPSNPPLQLRCWAQGTRRQQ